MTTSISTTTATNPITLQSLADARVHDAVEVLAGLSDMLEGAGADRLPCMVLAKLAVALDRMTGELGTHLADLQEAVRE